LIRIQRITARRIIHILFHFTIILLTRFYKSTHIFILYTPPPSDLLEKSIYIAIQTDIRSIFTPSPIVNTSPSELNCLLWHLKSINFGCFSIHKARQIHFCNGVSFIYLCEQNSNNHYHDCQKAPQVFFVYQYNEIIFKI
jgi:hypothetical protein